MKNPTRQENYCPSTVEREAHSPLSRAPHQNGGDGAKESAFRDLLETDRVFYQRVSGHLTRLAASMGVPPSEIDEVVAEAWLAAVKNCHLFSGAGIRRRLVCWLRKVVRGKAVDAMRLLGKRRYESLGRAKEELVDEREKNDAETTEDRSQLNELIVRLQREDPDNCWLVAERYLGRKRIKELAEETGWSANEIRCRIYRGMERLRSWASRDRPFCADAS